MVKAAIGLHGGVQRILTGMAESGMAKVMRQRQVSVNPHPAPTCAPRSVQSAPLPANGSALCGNNLQHGQQRLYASGGETRRHTNAVAVALKRCAFCFRLVMLATERAADGRQRAHGSHLTGQSSLLSLNAGQTHSAAHPSRHRIPFS